MMQCCISVVIDCIDFTDYIYCLVIYLYHCTNAIWQLFY